MRRDTRAERRPAGTSPGPGRPSRALRLRPPPGTTAALLDVGGEELLVLRIPLRGEEPAAALSASERAVAELALSGLSNADIARRRGTSARTVANQLASVFRKLGVGSRAELARRLVAGGTP